MLDEYGGIPRQAQILVIISIIPSVALGFLYTDVSYYLTSIQGIAPFWEGLVITSFGLAIVCTSIPLGIVADRTGRRKMLVLGNLLQGGALLGFAVTANVGLLIVFAVAEGIGEAAFAVSLSALIADRAGDEKRTPAFSLSFSVSWIGMALGALLTNLAALVPNATIFELAGVASLAVTPLAFAVTDTARVPRRSVLPKKSGGVMVRYGVYAACLGMGSGLFVPLMTQWFAAKYGTPDYVSGNVLVVSYLVTAGAILLAPRLARRVGTAIAIVITQGLGTVVMLGVPVSPIFAIAGTIYVARTFMMNLANPLGQSLLMGLVSPDERAAASGLVAVANRLPNALTAFPGAVLIGAGLYSYPFYIAAVIYTVAISWLWLMFRSAKLPEEGGPMSQPRRPSWKDSLTPAESQRP
jgi:MFS family permease